MKNDCSPLSVLKKALRQWFTEMLSEAVDRLTDFEVDFFTESQLQNHPPFEFDTEPGDYVLLFQLGSPDVEDFSVGKTIVRYEKEFPGLGQKILRKINDATPFDIGTPEHFLDVVRDNCWNGYSSDQEYLEEICAFEEEEELQEQFRTMDACPRQDCISGRSAPGVASFIRFAGEEIPPHRISFRHGYAARHPHLEQPNDL